ncbi:DUF262 domain-containing protein [Phocaeicola sartorii]|uniref:DUF262 domain-containing protein n=1 Tax=Phocaeicola sartorii TaxID=671267 RepID=UPI0025AA0766|nr:DUF262 domain-containing protein [Phocaeicola sartorii]
MSEKLKTFTFLQQLEQGYIRIPRIQRGYAQGRQTKKVEDIRKTFLHTLFQVIKGFRSSTELDFVYGTMKDGVFEPLDGQQRLTTLFLIHWMLGVDLRRDGDDKKSVFSYASCSTSEDFSNELVSHDALALIKEAIEKQATPSELITKRDWFHWKWKFDPSVSSMLVVIDDIYKELTTNNEVLGKSLDTYRQNLNNITFNGLNLVDFGLSNELFIKMNARGKQLSDFDKMKSTLEEEIQIQQSEHDENGRTMASSEDEANWRSLMDGKWSDYFWHTYARKLITESQEQSKEERKNTCLVAAKKCELQFKKFLLRLIQLQLHSYMPASEALREACYKMNASEIDDILLVYSDSLLSFRSKEDHKVSSSETRINFPALINTVNSLLIKNEDGTISDIYGLLPDDIHFNSGDTNLMQAFLDETLPNDVALTFFASLLFLEAYPYTENSEWRSNFSRWIKSFRNMLANNNNTQRIDKRWRYENAMKAISDITTNFVKFGKDNHLKASDYNYVNCFFNSIKDEPYVGIDNQALKEEIQKAALVLANPEWEQAIAEAEKDPYLWGQIRALMAWAGDDIAKFKSYSSKLVDLLGFIRVDCNKFYIAALKLNPLYWESSNRLYLLNFDRDNSFKRYLRDFDKDQSTNAPLIKEMIDLWIDTANDLDAREFIDDFISKGDSVSPTWIECIINDPSTLDYCNHKRLFIDKGHVILAQYKTMGSHCIDPVLKYIHTLALRQDSPKQVMFYDSQGDDPHSISYAKEEGNYHLKWSNVDGMYELTKSDGSIQTYCARESIDIFSNLLTDN